MVNNSYKLKPNIIKIFFILAIASLVTVLMLVRDYGRLPINLDVTVTNAVTEVRTNEGSIIIDSGMDRLIFLDKDDKVIKLQDSIGLGKPVTYYCAAAASDDGYYISEYSLYSNSHYIQSESINKYSFQGECLGKVLEINHSLDGDRTLQAQFWSICIEAGQGYVTGADTLQHQIYVWDFPLEPTEECQSSTPLMSFIAPANDKFVINSFFVSEHPLKIAALTNIRHLYLLDLQQPQNTYPAYAGPFDYESLEYPLDIDMDQAGQFQVKTKCQSEGRTLAYSWPMVIRQLSFWLALVYLSIFLLYWLCRGMYKLWHKKDYVLFERLAAVSTGVAFCIGITAFYSVYLMHDYERDMDRALQESVYLLESNSPNPLERAFQEAEQTATINQDTAEQSLRILETAAIRMNEIGYDMNFGLVAYNKENKSYWLLDSAGDVLLGQSCLSQLSFDQIQAINNCLIIPKDSAWGQYEIAVLPVKNEQGETIGAVASYIDTNNLNLEVIKQSGRLLLILLPALMMIGFVLVEGSSALKSAMKYREKRREGSDHAEVAMVRPTAFLLWVAGTATSALFPIIVTEMTTSAYLVAASVSLFNLGYLVGTPMIKWLNLRWQLRNVVLFGSAMMLLSFVTMYYSCLMSNVWLFLVGAFTLNVFFQVVDIYVNSLSFLAQDSRERATWNRSVYVARISAMSISTFVSGILASWYGNAAIELFGAVMVIISMTMLYYIVPQNAKMGVKPPKGRIAAASVTTSFWQSLGHICKDRQAIAMVLLILFPSFLLQTYKSYIFPLYAFDIGLDKAIIGNILAFTGAFVFYCAPLMNYIEEKLGTARGMYYSGILISGTFMLFLLDGSAVWAVVALIICQFSFKCMEPSMYTYWQERTLATNTNINDAQIVYSSFTTAFKTVRSNVVCIFLQIFGQTIGCFAMGAYAMVSIIGFALVNKRKGIK